MPTNRDADGAMNRFPVPVTSSWSISLPDGYAAIGISRGPPRGRRGYRMYSALAPGAWFRSVDETRFVELYRAQLATLDAKRVLADLAMIADDRIPALMCFENPPPNPTWCHRGMVAVWLKEAAGVDVHELGFESFGSGWSHPKLPSMLRRP
jgi:hypothetical protein